MLIETEHAEHAPRQPRPATANITPARPATPGQPRQASPRRASLAHDTLAASGYLDQGKKGL